MPFKDDLHKFVDNHIREIKYVSYGLGALGLVLIVKDLHLASRFRRVSEIPQKFVASHVTLQGCVREVGRDGILHVDHAPVFTLPLSGWIHRLKAGTQEPGCLAVELAGVEMGAPAVDWLRERAVSQHVWFQMMHSSGGTLLCSVHMKKNVLLKMNVNKALVQSGLAAVDESKFLSLPEDDAVRHFLMALRGKEAKARRKQLGMWKDVTTDPAAEKPSAARRILGWPVKKLREMFRKKS